MSDNGFWKQNIRIVSWSRLIYDLIVINIMQLDEPKWL